MGFVQGNKAGFCGVEVLTGECEPVNDLKHTFSGRKAIWVETDNTFLKKVVLLVCWVEGKGGNVE